MNVCVNCGQSHYVSLYDMNCDYGPTMIIMHDGVKVCQWAMDPIKFTFWDNGIIDNNPINMQCVVCGGMGFAS